MRKKAFSVCSDRAYIAQKVYSGPIRGRKLFHVSFCELTSCPRRMWCVCSCLLSSCLFQQHLERSYLGDFYPCLIFNNIEKHTFVVVLLKHLLFLSLSFFWEFSSYLQHYLTSYSLNENTNSFLSHCCWGVTIWQKLG